LELAEPASETPPSFAMHAAPGSAPTPAGEDALRLCPCCQGPLIRRPLGDGARSGRPSPLARAAPRAPPPDSS
jgi:hypothetical protein